MFTREAVEAQLIGYELPSTIWRGQDLQDWTQMQQVWFCTQRTRRVTRSGSQSSPLFGRQLPSIATSWVSHHSRARGGCFRATLQGMGLLVVHNLPPVIQAHPNAWYLVQVQSLPTQYLVEIPGNEYTQMKVKLQYIMFVVLQM